MSETQTEWTAKRVNPYQKLLTKANLDALPPLYATEHTKAKDKVIQVHFFFGSYDGYFCEFAPEEGLFYGWVSLGYEGEWGYTSAEELCSVGRIERDLHFIPKPASEIPEIMRGIQ